MPTKNKEQKQKIEILISLEEMRAVDSFIIEFLCISYDTKKNTK